MIGEPLPRQPIAWFWVMVFALLAAYFSHRAAAGEVALWLPIALGTLLIAFLTFPFLGKRGTEYIEIDDVGITQAIDGARTTTHWSEVVEVAIATTDQGPFAEDVFFVLGISDTEGCVVTHAAAERIGLLPELQARFPGLDDKKVIEAMGCTNNNRYVLWSKSKSTE